MQKLSTKTETWEKKFSGKHAKISNTTTNHTNFVNQKAQKSTFVTLEYERVDGNLLLILSLTIGFSPAVVLSISPISVFLQSTATQLWRTFFAINILFGICQLFLGFGEHNSTSARDFEQIGCTSIDTARERSWRFVVQIDEQLILMGSLQKATVTGLLQSHYSAMRFVQILTTLIDISVTLIDNLVHYHIVIIVVGDNWEFGGFGQSAANDDLVSVGDLDLVIVWEKVGSRNAANIAVRGRCRRVWKLLSTTTQYLFFQKGTVSDRNYSVVRFLGERMCLFKKCKWGTTLKQVTNNDTTPKQQQLNSIGLMLNIDLNLNKSTEIYTKEQN